MATHGSAIQISSAVKGLALILFLCVAIRVFSSIGADTISKNYMTRLVANESFVESILNFELGTNGMSDSTTLASILLDSTIFSPDTTAAVLNSAPPDESPAPAENTVGHAYIDDVSLYYNMWPTQNNNTPAPDIITKPAGITSIDTIAINNKTDFVVDTAALLKEPINFSLSKDGPVVLIIHTHGSEAYMPDGSDQYVESDPYRTQDTSKSVTRIGDELAAAFEEKGISAIHDSGVYDYPSYNGSYTRSCSAIQSYLKKYPSIKIVIDLHRDAIGTDDTVYKTIAQIGDTTCSQIMFVMGTNDPARPHPNWRENFKLAAHIQQEMNKLYPSLAKPIELSTLRYNQQLTQGSMIIEVGSIGNTLQESLAAVRYFADAASAVLLGLYK